MARLSLLLAVVCALPVLSVLANPLDMDPNDIISQNELQRILGTIAAPFTQVKQQRNNQLDAIMDHILTNFRPILPTLNNLQSQTNQLCLGVPQLRKALLPGITDGMAQLSTSIAQAQTLITKCHGGSNPTSDLSELSSLTSMMAPLVAASSALKVEDQVALCQSFTQRANLSTVDAAAQTLILGESITCDDACVASAVGASSSGKHVHVNDVAKAFTYILTSAMEQHRQRYLALYPKVTRAGLGVTQAAQGLGTTLAQSQAIVTEGEALRTRAQGLMSAYLTGVKQLNTALGKVTC